MCASPETLRSVLFCNCSFFLSFCWIPPSLHPHLHVDSICLASSSFHLSPGSCIIVTRTSPTHAWNAPVSTWPCSCNQKCTNWSARTVKIICMGSDSTRVLLFCTATHCVHAKLLSLLVERCYALLSSGEGKHPVASTGYQLLPHPSTCCSTALSRVQNWVEICMWEFNDHPNTRGIHLLEKLGRFLLVEEDQKWKVRLPRCKWGPRDTCKMEIKGLSFFQKNMLDPLFHFSLHTIIIYGSWKAIMIYFMKLQWKCCSKIIFNPECRNMCAAPLTEATVHIRLNMIDTFFPSGVYLITFVLGFCPLTFHQQMSYMRLFQIIHSPAYFWSVNIALIFKYTRTTMQVCILTHQLQKKTGCLFAE